MVTTRPPKTIVKPTALGPVANTDTKLLIYGLFQKGPSFGTGRRRVQKHKRTQDPHAADIIIRKGRCRSPTDGDQE